MRLRFDGAHLQCTPFYYQDLQSILSIAITKVKKIKHQNNNYFSIILWVINIIIRPNRPSIPLIFDK